MTRWRNGNRATARRTRGPLVGRRRLRIRPEAAVHHLIDIYTAVFNRVGPAYSNRPQAVDRPAPRERKQPGGHAPFARVVRCGLPPRLREHFLHDVLGFALTCEDLKRQRVHWSGIPVIDISESGRIAPCDPSERRLIVGVVLCSWPGRCGRVYWRPQYAHKVYTALEPHWMAMRGGEFITSDRLKAAPTRT